MISPPTACSTQGCSGHAVAGKLCPACSATHTTTSNNLPSKFDKHRAWRHLYNTVRWRDLRGAILRRDPVCKECGRLASTVADHVKDHRGDLRLFYDPNNLRGVCKECHDKKTGSTHGAGDREEKKPALVNGMIREYAI